MSSSLIISLNTTLKNPSKKQLLYAANLLLISPPLTPVTVRYTVLDGTNIIRTDRVQGSVVNSRIVCHLSTFDYLDHDIDVKEFLKKMA
jgi:hypothetical protein